jgi:hypothetical protein
MNARRQHNESRFDPVVLVEETKEQFVEDKSDPCPDFQPGLIVKIILDEPISDAKRFKVFLPYVTTYLLNFFLFVITVDCII